MLDRLDIAEAESNGHSLFGASKAHRYLVCSGSLLGELGKPDTADFPAAEGTVAHEIAATWLTHDKQRGDFDDAIGTFRTVTLPTGKYIIPIDAAMLNYLESYVEWCRAVPGEHHYEKRVSFARLCPIPDQGGTADHFAIVPGTLTITDLKYGTGVQVFAERNAQAMLYALGVLYEWDWLYSFDRIVIRICQPRLKHFDVWETTAAELLEWAEWAKLRMVETWKPHAPLTPTESACKFCKCRGTCPAAAVIMDRMRDPYFTDTTIGEAEVSSAIEALAEPPVLRTVRELTTAEIAKMLEYRKVVEHHFEAAYTELERRVLQLKEPMPDRWMLAQGKTSRSVADERGIVGVVSGLGLSVLDLWDSQFKSPAAIEKMLGRNAKLIEKMIRSVPGKPTLALAGPGKKAAVDAADRAFADETVK